ncbi:unnamed protein product [Amoebophrya sp. A120]|nr:unnamed protein product [Amoebophrya sp. A120]|eukprot:GSA120T00007047001.1
MITSAAREDTGRFYRTSIQNIMRSSGAAVVENQNHAGTVSKRNHNLYKPGGLLVAASGTAAARAGQGSYTSTTGGTCSTSQQERELARSGLRRGFSSSSSSSSWRKNIPVEDSTSSSSEDAENGPQLAEDEAASESDSFSYNSNSEDVEAVENYAASDAPAGVARGGGPPRETSSSKRTCSPGARRGATRSRSCKSADSSVASSASSEGDNSGGGRVERSRSGGACSDQTGRSGEEMEEEEENYGYYNSNGDSEVLDSAAAGEVLEDGDQLQHALLSPSAYEDEEGSCSGASEEGTSSDTGRSDTSDQLREVNRALRSHQNGSSCQSRVKNDDENNHVEDHEQARCRDGVRAGFSSADSCLVDRGSRRAGCSRNTTSNTERLINAARTASTQPRSAGCSGRPRIGVGTGTKSCSSSSSFFAEAACRASVAPSCKKRRDHDHHVSHHHDQDHEQQLPTENSKWGWLEEKEQYNESSDEGEQKGRTADRNYAADSSEEEAAEDGVVALDLSPVTPKQDEDQSFSPQPTGFHFDETSHARARIRGQNNIAEGAAAPGSSSSRQVVVPTTRPRSRLVVRQQEGGGFFPPEEVAQERLLHGHSSREPRDSGSFATSRVETSTSEDRAPVVNNNWKNKNSSTTRTSKLPAAQAQQGHRSGGLPPREFYAFCASPGTKRSTSRPAVPDLNRSTLSTASTRISTNASFLNTGRSTLCGPASSSASSSSVVSSSGTNYGGGASRKLSTEQLQLASTTDGGTARPAAHHEDAITADSTARQVLAGTSAALAASGMKRTNPHLQSSARKPLYQLGQPGGGQTPSCRVRGGWTPKSPAAGENSFACSSSPTSQSNFGLEDYRQQRHQHKNHYNVYHSPTSCKSKPTSSVAAPGNHYYQQPDEQPPQPKRLKSRIQQKLKLCVCANSAYLARERVQLLNEEKEFLHTLAVYQEKENELNEFADQLEESKTCFAEKQKEWEEEELEVDKIRSEVAELKQTLPKIEAESNRCVAEIKERKSRLEALEKELQRKVISLKQEENLLEEQFEAKREQNWIHPSQEAERRTGMLKEKLKALKRKMFLAHTTTLFSTKQAGAATSALGDEAGDDEKLQRANMGDEGEKSDGNSSDHSFDPEINSDLDFDEHVCQLEEDVEHLRFSLLEKREQLLPRYRAIQARKEREKELQKKTEFLRGEVQKAKRRKEFLKRNTVKKLEVKIKALKHQLQGVLPSETEAGNNFRKNNDEFIDAGQGDERSGSPHAVPSSTVASSSASALEHVRSREEHATRAKLLSELFWENKNLEKTLIKRTREYETGGARFSDANTTDFCIGEERDEAEEQGELQKMMLELSVTSLQESHKALTQAVLDFRKSSGKGQKGRRR